MKRIRFCNFFRGERATCLRPRRIRERGFIFLAALGIMAVLVIVSATANITSVNSLQQVVLSHESAQASLLLQSVLRSAALANLGETETIIYQQEQSATEPFAAKVSAVAKPLQQDDPIYAEAGFPFQAGDRLLTINVTTWRKEKEYGSKSRKFLWNPASLGLPVELGQQSVLNVAD